MMVSPPPTAAPRGAALLGRSLLRLFTPGGGQAVSILIYHRVLARPDPLFPGEVDRAQFDRQIGLLTACCTVIPLIEAVRHARAGSMPPRAACITFDDGYADNAEIALPVLQRHGVHATFFVATGFLDGGRMWNDTVIELVRRSAGDVLDAVPLGLGAHPIATPAQRQSAIGALIGQLKYLAPDERLRKVGQLATLAGAALPTDLMMRSEQVRALHRAGMEIGAHTVNHPILARLAPAQARAEMAEGKAALEALTGAPVRLFAYPNGKPGGDYGADHVAMARELGFEGAVSTAWGASRQAADPYQLPRFTPWDRTPLRFVARLARNLTFNAARASA